MRTARTWGVLWRGVVGAALVALVLSLLTACTSLTQPNPLTPGGPDGSSATAVPALPQLTPADVEFAQGMLPHHKQGVELATLALVSVTDPEVRAVAERIVETQTVEQKFLTTWLASISPDYRAAHSHNSMSGMLSEHEVTAFASLRGEGARSQFLRLMIAHHQGAIEMANVRLSLAGEGTMTEFARSVLTEQQTEIDRMRALQ